MQFVVEQPDTVRSPFTGMTRRHWAQAARHLLEGVFGHVGAFDEPIVIPRQHAITYPQPDDPPWRFKSQEFEGLARTLMLAGPLLAEDPELEAGGYRLADYYANQVLQAADPTSPRYLMSLSEIIEQHGVQQYQHTVEGAALVIGLTLAGDSVWGRYSRAQRDRVARLISDYAHHRTIGHNWRFFNVLMMTFLKRNGYPVDDTAMVDHLQHLLSYDAGDGWYRDDETFDYYNPWGFHFYGPLWCAWYGYEHMPEVARLIEARNRVFMETYPRLFSRRGRQLMWGRSIIYRCAASAAFSACFLLRDAAMDPGWARRTASGNLLQFLGRDDTFLNRVPCLGYYGPFAPLVQFYSCAASPFWLSKAFLALALPDGHPFWTATENEGIWEQLGTRTERVFLEGPGLLVLNHGGTGETELLPAKSWKRDPFYNQLAYHTALPWESEASDSATAMTYAVRETDSGRDFHTPLRLGFFKEESGVLYRQYNTKPEGLGDPNKGGINKGPEKIDLADLAVEGGLVRVDRVRIPYAYELSLGHYGLPHLDGAAPEVRRREVNGCPAVTAAIPGRRLALVAVYGWDGVDAVVHDGLHPEAATSTVPCAVCRRQKDYQGMAVLVTVLLHAADDGAWSDADLDVVRSVEVRPWSASGSPCGVGVALADGRRVEIDFGVIERGVVY